MNYSVFLIRMCRPAVVAVVFNNGDDAMEYRIGDVIKIRSWKDLCNEYRVLKARGRDYLVVEPYGKLIPDTLKDKCGHIYYIADIDYPSLSDAYSCENYYNLREIKQIIPLLKYYFRLATDFTFPNKYDFTIDQTTMDAITTKLS